MILQVISTNDNKALLDAVNAAEIERIKAQDARKQAEAELADAGAALAELGVSANG